MALVSGTTACGEAPLACGEAPLACGEAPPDPEERVFLLGIDGASWTVMEPMLAAGELPGFARLLREGAAMPRFRTLDSTSSPVVWTTVATGRAPTDHGIQGFTAELPNGRRIPVSSASRKAKAIWELAGEYGLSVGVAGWWASWPAEPVNGWIVTDHASPAFGEYTFADGRYPGADRERRLALGRDVHPPELADVLTEHWLDKGTFDYAELAARSGLRAPQVEALRIAPWNRRDVYSLFKTFYRIDRPLFGAARALYGDRPTRLTLLYLRGPDPVQHYGWNLVEPERYAQPAPNLARDRGLVQAVYRYLDGFLQELLEVLDERTWLIVASDHGAEPTPEASVPGFEGRPGEHSTAARGVLFVWGPHVRAGYRIPHADPGDLMPTIAWLLGIPLSRQLIGEPLLDAFEPAFAAGRPLEHVPDYGPRTTGSLAESPADAALLESLRALGYID